MSGYCYGDPEPTENCPYCRESCSADFVDIGVGFQQCGPYHCQNCGASQIGPNDKERPLADWEKETGWYQPASPPGSSANVDHSGQIIGHREADDLYRASRGVGSRRWGRLIS